MDSVSPTCKVKRSFPFHQSLSTRIRLTGWWNNAAYNFAAFNYHSESRVPVFCRLLGQTIVWCGAMFYMHSFLKQRQSRQFSVQSPTGTKKKIMHFSQRTWIDFFLSQKACGIIKTQHWSAAAQRCRRNQYLPCCVQVYWRKQILGIHTRGSPRTIFTRLHRASHKMSRILFRRNKSFSRHVEVKLLLLTQSSEETCSIVCRGMGRHSHLRDAWSLCAWLSQYLRIFSPETSLLQSK